MARIGLRVTFPLLAVLMVCQGSDNKPTEKEQRDHSEELRAEEISVSTQVWQYPRVYPLLDGLFQDVAATQISQLTLNPNTSNGTSLDALQQSFQLQLQYSQLAGIQNSAAAQVTSANAGYQTQLAQLGAQLLQQFAQATALATQAQAAYNALSTNPNASTTDLATAQQVLTAANAMVNNLGSQITNLKAPPAPTVPTTPSPLASAPTTAPPGLNSTIQTNGANATTTGAPTFPATKQMDNQMELLWERLSRLVGVMSRPDSMPTEDDIFLVQFNTSINPIERKKELLDTTYELTCGAKVIDLFPRVAALNITEEKYRDTSFGLGAVLNFFGLGGTISYNREHLKATQLLGQSSYITGHGVGQTEFGWLFGISLGDDSISPGARSTFALIEAPPDTSACSPAIKLKKSVWTKPPKFAIASPAAKCASYTQTLRQKLAKPGDNSSNSGYVQSIDFSRVEYDPTTGKPAPVMITVVFNHDMDQQQTVTVNGIFVNRVRDNFARAITASANNSGGVLEVQGAVGINTWIPTSPRSMLLNLDASLFGGQFPLILLNSPSGSIIVGPGKPEVTVSGRKLHCESPESFPAIPAGTPTFSDPSRDCVPPSLGFQKSTPVTLGVARWIQTDASDPIDLLSITVVNTPTPGAISNSNGIPAVQLVSDLDTPTSGATAEVDLLSDPGSSDPSSIVPLACVSVAGSRLLCRLPKSQPSGGRFTLQVIDQNHTGGPIKGLVSTEPCEKASTDPTKNCRQPLIWKMNSPVLADNNQVPPGGLRADLAKSEWDLRILLQNVDPKQIAELSSPSFKASTEIACGTTRGSPCMADFKISRKDLGRVSDFMKFDVLDPTSQKSLLARPASILNLLTNLKPLIGSVSPDFKSFWGQNLVYDKIVVNSKSYDLDCESKGGSCSGAPPYGAASGIMYFLAADAGFVFPFMQVNAAGANTAVVYTPPAKQADNGGAQPAAGSSPVPKAGLGSTQPSATAAKGAPPNSPLQLMTSPFSKPGIVPIVGNLAPRIAAQQ